MRVRLSSDARAYIRRETRYLRERSMSGADKFKRIVQRAKAQLAEFPESGLTDSAIALTGARRVNIDGYLFDYDIEDDGVRIQNVRSSVNTPIIEIEDDVDYEANDELSATKGPN